jgi:hypothetical protein
MEPNRTLSGTNGACGKAKGKGDVEVKETARGPSALLFILLCHKGCREQ